MFDDFLCFLMLTLLRMGAQKVLPPAFPQYLLETKELVLKNFELLV